ncbi:hypothetical protein LCGC14_0555130 [marine sediment metagenome]|uniref:Uncharacterized protein n=1 Tax=marine sediment metagenome TaxID=412755 RepID=A0A0F9S7C9_9ZZZZ
MVAGDIGSVIDSLDYLNEGGYVTRLIHVAGEIYLVGDQPSAAPGETMVYSFSVDAAGNISDAVIRSLVLHTAAGRGGPVGGFAHVSGDVFAAAYVTRYKTVVGTFTCDSSGILGAAVIDTIELEDKPGNAMWMPDIRKVTGNVFVVSYTQDFTDDGLMKTITINDDGTIDEPELDSWKWDTNRGTKPYILQVSAARYLQIRSQGASYRGWIDQVSITDAGIISLVSYGSFDSVKYVGGTVHRVSGDVYAIFYEGGPNNTYGMVTTVLCSFLAWPGPTVIDSWEYYSGATAWPRAVEVSLNSAGTGKVFAVATSPGVPDVPQVNTIEVLNDGTITKSIVDSQQLSAGYAYNPDILRHAPGIYLISARVLAPAKQTVYTFDIEEAEVSGVGGIAYPLVGAAFI